MWSLRDISLRKRLVGVNFLMVSIPVLVLAILGAALFLGLRLTGTARQSELALLWPDEGKAMSIPYALTSLQAKLDSPKPLHLDDIFEETVMLESHDVHLVVIADGRLLYISPKSDGQAIMQAVYDQCGDVPAAFLWQGETLAFTYTSPDGLNRAWAAGTTPFAVPPGGGDTTLRDRLQALVFLILGLSIAVIIWLGLSLSRIVSRQVLDPLQELRHASAAIRDGNLDTPVSVPSHDEIGKTCQDFEAMRCDLVAARDRQRQYEQNRKELIAGISHDLATPLTLLKGYASGIRDGIARTPEKQRLYVEKMYTTACSMEALVDSLFLFSKLDLGRLPLHMERLPLGRYIEDVCGELQYTYGSKGLVIRLKPCPQTVYVRVDAMQFRRVLENIVTNALKYGKTKETVIDVSYDLTRGEAAIHWADHGQGVPKESLGKLFDSFYRTDGARTDVTKGSGLGLAIAKQIMTAFGGAIGATETPGGGLTITLRLPTTEERDDETHINH